MSPAAPGNTAAEMDVLAYAKEMGIELNANINNAIELRKALEGLDKQDKKKIL